MTAGGRPGFLQAVRLAGRDFRHDWKVSLCLCVALAAVMTPLMVLFGLKSGIVTTLQTRLLSDPRNREVVVVGSYSLDAAWFAALTADPRTGFAVPRTRSLAATLDVRAPSGKAEPGLELVPTAPGDPLVPEGLRRQPLAEGAVYLSQSAATTLGVVAGDSVVGQISRTVSNRTEVRRWPLTVAGIVPDSLFSRPAVFAPLAFLVAAEDWRDGRDAPSANRLFASLRLFAADLDAVAPLAETLRQKGLEVRTRAAEIESVQLLDRSLTRVLSLLLGLAVLGFLLSLGASLWAAVERKRRDLALLRLLGFDGLALALVPVTQGVLVAVGGVVLSSLLYWPSAAFFNATLAGTLAREEFVCRLDPLHYGLGVLLTLLLAVLAAAGAARKVARIDPAESLREI
ncbi:FtsX-like permease family protein [Novispirillum itersonii]|uniref:Putative ABC transport system permease protein n=1 Tax=Novispirillum itersonii TaxID=189 RepID=A0A7W9ZJC2_NOVIT|nr:FtsX-like permease family protein [Novispirillum itersonii]MBB6212240.1 putative ABC transport system permease protein [Novispirillum itersonii]